MFEKSHKQGDAVIFAQNHEKKRNVQKSNYGQFLANKTGITSL